tara:strand:- start:18 stop:524 length:507 start_codon:yes stop_codon:yes gene_type:complete
MKELYRFRQFLAEGVTTDEITSRVRKLGKEKGIEDKYIEDYIDELDGNFEPDAYENSTDKDLLDDLKSYIDLSEGVIKEEDIAEMAYERDSVEDIVKRIKPILANHPQLKKQEDPEQYLIDFVTKRKRFINKNEAPIGKDKFAYNVGTMPYDKYINLQFNEYIYSTTP